MMRLFRIRSFSLAVLTVLPVVACTNREPVLSEEEVQMKPVQMALSLGTLPSGTKMDVEEFTEMGIEPAFRGIADIRVIPFEKTTPVEGEDHPIAEPQALPGISSQMDEVAYSEGVFHTGLIVGSNAHFYPEDAVSLPLGTGAALLYGRPVSLPTSEGAAALKHLNGSLLEEGVDNMDYRSPASLIHFSPDPIYQGSPYPEAAVLRTIMDRIVLGDPFQIDYYSQNGAEKLGTLTFPWDADSWDGLGALYASMVNDGRLMGGSGRMVLSLIRTLYKRLCSYNNEDSTQYESYYKAGGVPLRKYDICNGLRDVIKKRIEKCDYLEIENGKPVFKDPALGNYPRSYGLPEGSTMLRFTPSGFVIPTVDGADNMAPMSAFCYPPALYYYSNSTLLSSPADDVYTRYTSATGDWDTILDGYRFGRAVSRDSKSVAFTAPLQYAVGMLDVTVRATAALLADNDGNNVSVGESSFPVTGIIVGGQYRQAFDFTPDGEIQHFVYDNLLEGIYLTTTEAPVTPVSFRTLVLQSVAYEDVYFCLELQNDSGSSFYGMDGKIEKGQKFYLTGKMTMPDNPSETSVIVQDHITYLSCTVSSLEAARVTIPDLGMPQFSLGVQAQVNWEMSAPITVILD